MQLRVFAIPQDSDAEALEELDAFLRSTASAPPTNGKVRSHAWGVPASCTP